ncbi:putative membrane protein [Halorubrum sp. AJ67]|nr:putative membrane protein [Halorubrum sp. AJ67]
MRPQLESLLLGKSLKRSLRYLGYSVILMGLFFGQLYLTGNFDVGTSSSLLMSPLGATVSASILAGIHIEMTEY